MSYHKRCGNDELRLGAGTATHYASIRCAACNRFIRWLSKPETEERRRDQNTQIDKLLGSSNLSCWEREFLESLKGQPKRSPRQLEILGNISLKVGGAT